MNDAKRSHEEQKSIPGNESRGLDIHFFVDLVVTLVVEALGGVELPLVEEVLVTSRLDGTKGRNTI